MEKARVYYTDFRAKLGEGLPTKLKRLMKKAGISEIDMEIICGDQDAFWRDGEYQLSPSELCQGGC